ncbi:hypothetical protein GKQ38_00800 [Candidatus Nanohaloarchaea archaeon]|nr:hypothetical protein GKQ38_00800 [Candidatus Nanohaloarchaea archaeon]
MSYLYDINSPLLLEALPGETLNIISTESAKEKSWLSTHTHAHEKTWKPEISKSKKKI